MQPLSDLYLHSIGYDFKTGLIVMSDIRNRKGAGLGFGPHAIMKLVCAV